MITWMLEPFAYDFMVRGLIAGLLIGITCATLGTFVVLRGMAFIGDALAHTILPGIVIAFLQGANLFVGALIAGAVSALGIGWISKERHLREDTAIGVIFSGVFALGIYLLSSVNSYRDLTHILFGNILGVSEHDLWIIAVVTIIVLLVIVLFYKELLVASFDPGHAIAIGLSPDIIRYGLLLVLALAIVSGIQAVGVVMVVSLLVTPSATANLLTQQLPRMILVSAILSMLATVVGLYASYYADSASGATIVLTLTLFFLITFIFAPRRGLLWRNQIKRD